MPATPDLLPLPLLRRTPRGVEQAVRISIPPGIGRPGEHGQVQVIRGSVKSDINLGELPPEGSARLLFLPELFNETSTVFAFRVGEYRWVHTLLMKPARRWTVHVVLHSHTDLGFTDPLSDVVRIHNENTDMALRCCRETAAWPEGSRFKWTCEVSWQVQNYIRARTPAQVEALMGWIRRGAIDVGALYAGELTGLLGQEEAVRSLAYAARLRRDYNIPCDTALLSDVPGCAPGFVQIMAKSGVKNLIIADNNFIAPFLPRTDLPRPFFWEGESGTDVLCWYTDHPFYAYIEGEYYGLHDSVETVERMLVPKLAALEATGYPFDRFQVQYAFDNARLSFRPAEVVKEWNERWLFPRLSLSTAREFLTYLRANHAHRIQRRRGDWSDWWGGIVTGFPVEESLTRRCHGRAPALESFAAVTTLADPRHVYPARALDEIYDGLLAFDEHSGGGGVWSPKSAEQQEQALREGYGLLSDAASRLDELEQSTFAHLAGMIANPAGEPLRVVFNGSSYPVAGIPPFGYMTLPFIANSQFSIDNWQLLCSSSTNWLPSSDAALENDRCIVRVDPIRGGCLSLFDKHQRQELVRNGQSVNEAVVYLPHPIKEVELGKYIPEIYDGTSHPGEFLPWPANSLPRLERTPDGTGCRITHSVEGCPWLLQEYHLDSFAGGVRIVNRIPRGARDNPALRAALETFLAPKGHLYFRFPFEAPEGLFEFESTGMVVRPGTFQFKGACRDYFAVQKWCRVVSPHRSIVLALPDTPLVDVGSVGLMKFKETLEPDQSLLFVRAANLRDWGGKDESPYSKTEDLVVRFALCAFSATPMPGRTAACRFAAQAFPALSSARVPAGSAGPFPAGSHAFCRLAPENVELMTLQLTEEKHLTIRLRETAGVKAEMTVTFPGLHLCRAWRTMMTGEPLEEVPCTDDILKFPLSPFGIETFRLMIGDAV